VLIAVGSIHPESGAWYFEEPLQLPFHDGDWTVVIHDSQFHVIVSGQQPTDVATFRNELTSIVQGCLDSLGFLFAVPLQAEVRSIAMQGQDDHVQLALRRHGWPDLLDEQPELPLRAEASDLQPFVAATVQEPLARLALADLRAALQYPDDTLFYAYRAVESVRQWFISPGQPDDDDTRRQSWIAMRAALALGRPPLDRLAELAAGRRHGAAAPPTEAERLETLRIARPAVKAFVDYLTAQRPGEEAIGPGE
jgi:hypothetical protein